MKNTNITKSWFLEKTKTDKPLAKLTKRKKKEGKREDSNCKNKK